MRIIPSFKKCSDCQQELTLDEYYFSEQNGYVQPCRECTKERERKRRNPKSPRPRKNSLVKYTWQDAKITMKNRVVKASEITEADVDEVIAEGFGFILRGFDKNNGKSIF